MKSAISVEVKQEILAKVKLGEKVTALAVQYGVSDKTIYYWLRGEVIAEKIPGINRSLLAQLFQLSRRILYTRQADASAKDALLKEQIFAVLALHPAYGHRRIALELNLGKKRIRRVMKQYGIKPYKRQGR